MSTVENTFYSVNAETGENTENNLWQNGQPKMPKFLQERANQLSKKFHSANKEQRMLQANENRAQNLRNIQGKAQKFIRKAELAQEKKTKFGLQTSSNQSFNQVGSPFKLRGNMAEKASKDVINHQKSTSPVNVASNLEARFATFESNRSEHLEATVQRARKSTAKVNQAKKKKNQLRAQAVLTIGFVQKGTNEEVTNKFGWGSPMKLPSRLAARAESLQQRFQYSPTSMQQKAAANRKAAWTELLPKQGKSTNVPQWSLPVKPQLINPMPVCTLYLLRKKGKKTMSLRLVPQGGTSALKCPYICANVTKTYDVNLRTTRKKK